MNDHNDDSHDETQCEGLHLEMDFHIRNYGISKGSEDFKRWFETTFAPGNPSAAEDFGFSYGEHEGVRLIEVIAHNPHFSIDALESLFFNYRTDQRNIAEGKKPKLKVVTDGMN